MLAQGGRLAQLAAPTELLAAPASAFVADFLGGRQLEVEDGDAVGYSIRATFDPETTPIAGQASAAIEVEP